MTSVFQAQLRDRSAVEPLRIKSGWLVALGVVYVIAGPIAMSSAAFAATVTVFVVGVMMLILGIAEVINALQFKSGQFPALAGPRRFVHRCRSCHIRKPAGLSLELGGRRIF
jgi:uncharacterized membrane protein HdeD (DUF308 family)